MAIRSRNSSAITAVALIALACALAGCGRKGILDLPPSTSSYQEAPGPSNDVRSAAPAATANGNLYETDSNADKALVAPKGPKKRIILDPILD